MKHILNALFVGALMAATMAFGPPALASPEMGNDLIAAYNQSTQPAPSDTTAADFSAHFSTAPATASASARSTAGSEPLTYTTTNDTAMSQHFADASGVVGPGWRSAILRD